VVLSVTFMKDLLAGIDITAWWRSDLAFGWALLVLSILVGNFAYGAPLTGAGKANWMICLVAFAVVNLPAHLASGAGAAGK
jgi:hypothetical protein